jgi:hypothetical protein
MILLGFEIGSGKRASTSTRNFTRVAGLRKLADPLLKISTCRNSPSMASFASWGREAISRCLE